MPTLLLIPNMTNMASTTQPDMEIICTIGPDIVCTPKSSTSILLVVLVVITDSLTVVVFMCMLGSMTNGMETIQSHLAMFCSLLNKIQIENALVTKFSIEMKKNWHVFLPDGVLNGKKALISVIAKMKVKTWNSKHCATQVSSQVGNAWCRLI